MPVLSTCFIRYPLFYSSPFSGLALCHLFFVHPSPVHSFIIPVTNPLANSSTNPHTVPAIHQFSCVLPVYHLLVLQVISFPTSKSSLHNSGLFLLAQTSHLLILRASRDSVRPDLFISCNNTNHKMSYIFHSPTKHYLLNLEKLKIYIKIYKNIAPTCFGLRPSAGSLF